jgi:hypothetical protein
MLFLKYSMCNRDLINLIFSINKSKHGQRNENIKVMEKKGICKTSEQLADTLIARKKISENCYSPNCCSKHTNASQMSSTIYLRENLESS